MHIFPDYYSKSVSVVGLVGYSENHRTFAKVQSDRLETRKKILKLFYVGYIAMSMS